LNANAEKRILEDGRPVPIYALIAVRCLLKGA
jgi:hypothetical protein